MDDLTKKNLDLNNFCITCSSVQKKFDKEELCVHHSLHFTTLIFKEVITTIIIL